MSDSLCLVTLSEAKGLRFFAALRMTGNKAGGRKVEKRVKVLEGKPGWALPKKGPLPRIEFPPLPDIYVEIPEEVTLEFKGVDFIAGHPPGIVIKFERKD